MLADVTIESIGRVGGAPKVAAPLLPVCDRNGATQRFVETGSLSVAVGPRRMSARVRYATNTDLQIDERAPVLRAQAVLKWLCIGTALRTPPAFASSNAMFLESIFRTPLRRPGASVGADFDAQVLGSGRQGLQQPGHSDDRHHALHVVGEHIECHLG